MSTAPVSEHRRTARLSFLARLIVTCLSVSSSWMAAAALAHEPPETGRENWIYAPRVASEMAEAANNFLATLDLPQRVRGTYLFKDAERKNFHFFPIPRRGVPLKDLTLAQQQLAYGLFNTGLSQRGFWKALTIMSLGELLRATTPEGHNEFRDSDQYYVSIFGTPGDEGAWGWRMEGFHLSVNFTILDGKWIAYTPSFFGSIPATVKEGPRAGLQVLKYEEEWGRQLAQSLSPEQRARCFRPVPVFEETVGGFITGNAPRIERGKPRGIPAAEMTQPQRELLLKLVREYAHRHRQQLAEQDLARIDKNGTDKIYFSWGGGLQPGQPHHYLIQGPTFLIEYDNTQDGANHVHTVWRDFDNDFGEDLLLRHYEQHHHPHP